MRETGGSPRGSRGRGRGQSSSDSTRRRQAKMSEADSPTTPSRRQKTSARRSSHLSPDCRRSSKISPDVAIIRPKYSDRAMGAATRADSTLRISAVYHTFQMHVMPCTKFLQLKKLLPHQQLVESGDVVPLDQIECDSDQKPVVFFISHQWTSFSDPDHTGIQLRTLQAVLRRMQRGEMPSVGATLQGLFYEGQNQRVSSRRWASLARDAYIWIDYQSIPQARPGDTFDEMTKTMDDMKAAIDSIPSYLLATSVFISLCPPVPHRDLPGVVCNLETWLERAWCRLEVLALSISREKGAIPAVLVSGEQTAPVLLDANLLQPPGTGQLSCCRLGHVVTDALGVTHPIKCDLHAIAGVIETLLSSAIAHHRRRAEGKHLSAVWRAIGPFYLRGLPTEWMATICHGSGIMCMDCTMDSNTRMSSSACDHRYVTDAQRKINDCDGCRREAKIHFLRSGGYAHIDDAGKNGRYARPLLCATTAGNSQLVRILLDAGADVNARYEGPPIPVLGLYQHMTALHAAVAISEDSATIQALIEHHADVHALATRAGTTPLMLAAARGAAGGMRCFERICFMLSIPLNVEEVQTINQASALMLAAETGTSLAVRMLLDTFRADATKLTSHGGSVLINACRNPRLGIKTLMRINSAAHGAHLNLRVRVTSTKWSMAYRSVEVYVRAGLTRSRFMLELAHWRRSTALHWAAAHGRADVVQWLLVCGASPSLRKRNAMGCTPIDMSRHFGPFPHVEELLSAAMSAHIVLDGALTGEEDDESFEVSAHARRLKRLSVILSSGHSNVLPETVSNELSMHLSDVPNDLSDEYSHNYPRDDSRDQSNELFNELSNELSTQLSTALSSAVHFPADKAKTQQERGVETAATSEGVETGGIRSRIGVC